MTQDERWLNNWKEVITFTETNHQRPLKFIDSEKVLRNWWKHQQKLMNAGELKEPRLGMFKELLELSEKYRRKNQYA